MSLLPLTKGKSIRWLGRRVEVVAVNADTVAIRCEDGIVEIVKRTALEASQPRPKGGTAT